MKGVLLWALMVIAVMASASAASLEGKVYDYSLSLVEGAIVEISTEPAQRMVADNGRYRFEVPPGNYSLHAQSMRHGAVLSNITQEVVVVSQGTFTLDLILLPVFEESDSVDDLDPDEVELNLSDTVAQNSTFAIPLVWITLIFASAMIILMYAWKKKQYQKTRESNTKQAQQIQEVPKEEKKPDHNPSPELERPDLEALLRVLKDADGRSTQRDLRKALPFSEAKISLMIAELDHEGKLTKIKKGRGNIIILK